MPLQFRLKKGLRLFGGKLGIVDREKGEKIRAESSLSGFPASKTIELREDILGGGVLDPSEQLPSRGDSVCEYLQLLVAVIRPQELVIDVSETSQGPLPDPDHEVEYAVLKAASEGRWEEINQVFNRPSQQERVLLAQNKFGWSPLHFAVYYGHLNIVNQLVNVCRLPPEQKTEKGRTPLMVASGAGHLPVVKLLLETHRSNVNEEDSKSATAVLYAARRGHLPVVKVLLEHRADVFHKAKDSTTALHLTAYGGSIECLEYLLPLFGDRKFEVDEDGLTCLHCAVWGGSVPVVRYLVDQCGFDLGLRITAGLTPLMFAAVYGHLAMAKLLVETYRCDVNEEDSKSWTPVMYAALDDHLPVLKMLIEHGADVFHKAEDSATALHLAAYGGSIECLEYLLPLFGDRRFEMDEYGQTCLHYAVWGGSVPVMRYLVDQCGLDLGLRTAGGLDCFLLACKEGHQKIVRELLTRDEVDRNVVDEDGRDALDWASEGGHTELVQILLDEYGFPDTRDTGQSTPLDLAPDFAQDDIVEAALQSHESALEHVCWISSGIESLFVTLFGGDFPLVPVGEEEDAKKVIHLHVPPGAVRADGEGVVEVHYGVLPDGPFQIPEGYRLCSTAVYINYSQAQTTKPFLLSLPHWSGGPDHPVFVTSPHTLPEGEQYYPFRLLEGGEFGEGYGIVEVDGHCSLFALAYRLEDTSRYYASLWEREEGNILHSKVAVTFESTEWMRILDDHWPGWKKRFTESFEMKEDHIESCLTEDSGRGWHAACVGKNWVGPRDIEYVKKYKSDENELQYAVEAHLYPPAICHDVVQSEVPRHLQAHKHIYLRVHGAKQGVITFRLDVLEEKEGSQAGAQPPPQAQVVKTDLGSSVADYSGHLMLFRIHVSRKAAGKTKAVLEGLGLDITTIRACETAHHLNDEEIVQDGLIRWCGGKGTQPPTWNVLITTMEYAEIAQQDIEELKQKLGH